MAAISCLELIRYTLYFFDFFFGVLFWGIVSAQFRGFRGFNTLGPDVNVDQEENLTCAIFNVDVRDGEVVGIFSSTVCDAIIIMGAVMMCVLFIVVIWHSMACIGRTELPYSIEAFTLGIMSLLWFILAIIALARTPGLVRSAYTQLRAAISGGFLAGFSHLAGTLLACLQDWREH